MHSAAQSSRPCLCTAMPIDAPLKPLFTSPAEHSMPMYLQTSKHLCEPASGQPCTWRPCPSAGHGIPSAHHNRFPPELSQEHLRHLHTALLHAWLHSPQSLASAPEWHQASNTTGTPRPTEAFAHPTSIRPSAGVPSEAHTQPGQVKVTCNLIISPLFAGEPKHSKHHDIADRPIAALRFRSAAPEQTLSLLQASPPLSSPAADHHCLVRHLLGLLHVGHQLVSILHIAQVVDASQVGILGAKLVQGRVLQANWRAGAQGGWPWSSAHHADRQQTAARQGCMLKLAAFILMIADEADGQL